MAYSYLICFSIDPVESGFTCRSSLGSKQFKGFDAFNRCFHELAPRTEAKDITDVWDGYYRITLVQFKSDDRPEQLKKKLRSFPSTIRNEHMGKPLFTTRKIGLASDHFKLGQDFTDEPIALYVTPSSELVFDSVLKELKQCIDHTNWSGIPKRLLHMNVRLYSTTDERHWSWRQMKEYGIPEKVQECPLEFYHTTLQIIPSRETCLYLYSIESNNPWWIGVTISNTKCLGCQYAFGEKEWKGVCPRCKKYERIRPIWFIEYSATIDDSNTIDSSQRTAGACNGHDTLLAEFDSKLRF